MAELPRWILAKESYEGMEEEIHADLSAAFAQNILDRIPKDVDLSEYERRRVAAQANFNAMLAALNWERASDTYMIWALVNAENSGWWSDLGGTMEYDNFQEFAESIYQKADEANKRSSKSSDWRFIVGYDDAAGQHHRGLIDIMRDNGVPVNKAVALLSLESKWRAAISRMRMIERQYQNDPDEGAKQIIEIVETEILNPEVTVQDIREKAPGYQKAGTSPVSANGTGYIITTPDGGGLLTIRVDNSAQVTAIDHALRGIVQGDGAFFPRDYEALVRELHGMLVRGPYEVQREPLPDTRVRYQLDRAGKIEAVLPFKLEEITPDYKTFLSLISERALGYQAPVEDVEIFGFVGRDELHLLVTLQPPSPTE